MAQRIDAAAHDVVLSFPSVLTQAPAVLAHLRTASVYYAPEPLRAEYDTPRTLRERISPYTRTRRRIDRRGILSATRVITLSRWMATRLRDVYGVSADVVYPGVDSELITPGHGPRNGSVLSIGALQPVKGHELVIEALARFPEPRPRLTVIGDRGQCGPALQRLAGSTGVKLELLTGVPYETVVERYQRAAVVACAAEDEPFGLTPLEAMAAGTPVVAVDSGGYRETVDHKRTGLRVPRDADSLARGIARVLQDGDLARALASCGRADVSERWTCAASAAGMDRLLRQVAE
jgi:glycosyltransferase involved in cell wall biosynthesis